MKLVTRTRNGLLFVTLLASLGLSPACAKELEEVPAENIEDPVDIEAEEPDEDRLLADLAALRNPVVKILITGAGVIQLAPSGVGVCMSATPICGDIVTWKWIGSPHGAYKLVIEPKATEPQQPECFLAPIELTQGAPEATRQVSAECPAPTAWFYGVRCEDERGADCGAQPIDPGVIINN